MVREEIRTAKAQLVSPVMSRDGCPGRELDCLKSAWTEEGVSARICVMNSFEDRAKPTGTEQGVVACMYVADSLETGPSSVVEAIVCTQEMGREVVLAYMWRICMKTGPRREGRRSNRRHSANSLWERADSCVSVGASIVVPGVGGKWRAQGFN